MLHLPGVLEGPASTQGVGEGGRGGGAQGMCGVGRGKRGEVQEGWQGEGGVRAGAVQQLLCLSPVLDRGVQCLHRNVSGLCLEW